MDDGSHFRGQRQPFGESPIPLLERLWIMLVQVSPDEPRDKVHMAADIAL